MENNNKNKKSFVFSASIVVLCMSIFVVGYIVFNGHFSPIKIENNISNLPTIQQKLNLNKVYDTKFILDKNVTKTGKIYVPNYININLDESHKFAKDFSFDVSKCKDFPDYYYYADGHGAELKVYKYLAMLDYTTKSKTPLDSTKSTSFNKVDAIKKAVGFMDSKNLGSNYSYKFATYSNGSYNVFLINHLDDGFDNYAYPTTVCFDDFGDILKVQYYYYEYDKLDSVNLKSMQMAYYELPTNYDSETKIDLKSCKLVYTFEDSIVQPAYLFEGEFVGGGEFQYFIKAASFKK